MNVNKEMVHKLYWHMLNLLLLKQLVECLAYYFTLRESAYPPLENTMKLEQFKIIPEEKKEMWEWESSNGAVVQQRT